MGDAGAFRRRFERLLRRREDQVFFALCAVVGAGGAFLGEGFKRAFGAVWTLAFGTVDLPGAFSNLPPFLVVAVPTGGGLVAGLILYLMRKDGTSGHGVPEVMEVVTLGRRSARIRPVLKKTAAAFVGIASGGSIGREGPIIQLSTAFAGRVGKLLDLSEESYRILTAAGVAAGVSGAYSTPLAGVLFVAEIIVGTMNMRVLGAAGIAAVTAWVTADVCGFHHGAFFVAGAASQGLPIPDFVHRSAGEYGAYIALGAVCGIAATLFMKSLSFAGRAFSASRLPVPIRTAIGGLVVGLIALSMVGVVGNGFDSATRILREPGLGGALLLLALLKIVTTSASVGSGIPGGVFTPTLMIGAAVGAAFGRGLEDVFGASVAPASSYAQLGLAGLLAGTMHAPLLATVLTMELLDAHGFIAPLLLVSFVSRTVAKRIMPGSIYTDELRRKGFETEGPMQERVLRSLKVRDLVRTDIEPLSLAAPLDEIIRRFSATRALHLYVVDRDGGLAGAIDLHDVKSALTGSQDAPVVAADLAKPIPSALPSESIVEVNRRLWLQDVGHLPVVENEETRKLLGVVTRRDILGAVDRQVLRENVLMAPIMAADASSPDWFELPPGGKLDSVRVPPAMVGRTVDASKLGRRYGVTVLSVTKTDKNGVERRILPRPNLVLESGDRLVVVGAADAVDRLARGDMDPDAATSTEIPLPDVR